MKTAHQITRQGFLRPGPVPAAAVLGLILLTAASGLQAATSVPGAGGAVVNGEKLAAETVWQEYSYQNVIRNFIHTKPDGGIDEGLLQSVIRQVVRKELLLQEARRRGYSLDEDAGAAIRQQEVERWRSEENFVQVLAMMGVAEEFILNRAAGRMLVEKMIAADSEADKSVAEKDVRSHYDSNLGRYLSRDEPPLRYLFVSRETGHPFVMYGKIAREADALRTKGDTFAAVVEAYSEHATASAGGIVPEIEKTGTGLPLQPVTLKECRFSSFRPHETGLHMFLRDCRQPLPYAEVREQVRQDLIAARRSRYLHNLTEDLESRAAVELLPLQGEPPVRTGSGHDKQGPRAE